MNLYNIKAPNSAGKRSNQVMISIVMLIFGAVLGAFSKWLDSMSIDDAIWWQRLLGILDLRNVFSSFAVWLLLGLVISAYSRSPIRAAVNVFAFFAGMCVSYHWYTVAFCGFNPRRYMMIWYGITLLSPFFAVVCWYGKGKSRFSPAVDALILAVMLRICFSIGMYIHFKSVIDTLIFAACVFVLHSTPKQTAMSLAGAVILTYLFRIPVLK